MSILKNKNSLINLDDRLTMDWEKPIFLCLVLALVSSRGFMIKNILKYSCCCPPDRPFHNSRTLWPEDRRILLSSGTSQDGFWRSKFVKGSVGLAGYTAMHVVSSGKFQSTIDPLRESRDSTSPTAAKRRNINPTNPAVILYRNDTKLPRSTGLTH